MSRLEMNADDANAYIRGRSLAALMVLAAEGERRAKELVSIQGPPRSSPGNPPHMDTQQLHDGITSEVDAGQMAARFGTDVPHGFMLEVGTSKMAARPWLRRSAMELTSRADRVLEAGMGDEGATGTSVAGKAASFVKRTAKRVGSRVARFFGR